MDLYAGKLQFNGEWMIIDLADKTPAIVVSPKQAIVLCISTVQRDSFAVWDVMHDDGSTSCAWGWYGTKFEDAVEEYRRRLEVMLRERIETRAIRERATEDGRNAAKWLVDGNTKDPEAVLRRLSNGIADGDPQIMDELPSPRLGGEFADDPTWEDVLKAELDEYSDERLFNGEYDGLEDVYHEAFQEGVEAEINDMLREHVEA